MNLLSSCRLLTLRLVLPLLAALLLLETTPLPAWALASNNIPLDSQIYPCLEKLAGFGLLKSDVRGLKPYSKAEAARLLLEAEAQLQAMEAAAPPLAGELVARLRELLPREISLRQAPGSAPFFDYSLLSAARMRYVYLNGEPRSYERQVFVEGGQSVFGFIGGRLRPESDARVLNQSGTEGTPLLEYNEGVIHRPGSSAELRFSTEAFLTEKVSLLVEPSLLVGGGGSHPRLNKGYLKWGGGGAELEIGRDANWFGPGYRGGLTLTNNAENFDLVKISSPEPVDVKWVKRYLGELKYALIYSRFGETGSGAERRRPHFIGIKLAVKPRPWWEIGGNFVRQEGGPGFTGSSTLQDTIFGGGATNHNNSIAGIDLSFRIPWLRDTQIYGEYAGEDSALFWPFVESYVAGIFIPRLTASGTDDFRFEFFYGHPMLYTDVKFPAGYVHEGMVPAHSQGGSAIEFFFRYSHWFDARHRVALEYFRTDRGHGGRVGDQEVEKKHAGRLFWYFPLRETFDANVMYGVEKIDNFNLVGGSGRTNHLLKAELSYSY